MSEHSEEGFLVVVVGESNVNCSKVHWQWIMSFYFSSKALLELAIILKIIPQIKASRWQVLSIPDIGGIPMSPLISFQVHISPPHASFIHNTGTNLQNTEIKELVEVLLFI